MRGRAVSFSEKPRFCRGSATPTPRAYPLTNHQISVSDLWAGTLGTAPTENETALGCEGDRDLCNDPLNWY
jgi:hypothetical protein